MINFDGALHVGTHNQATGCEVWSSTDGNGFAQVNRNGFGESENLDASSMARFGGGLYVGTKDWERGCEVWRSGGTGGPPYTDWEKVAVNGLAGATWYVAEGSTGPGFETWILVQNPGGSEARVSLTYMTGEGEVEGPEFDIAAGSRHTVEVAATVESYDVSTTVNSNRPVVVERALYWGDRQCATGSVGFDAF